jgi:hypothetical protein
MTQSLEDLASTLQNPNPNARAGALIVGFDGTAALLGHPDRNILRDQLLGSAPPRDLGKLIREKVKGQADPFDRFAFMQGVSSPRRGQQSGAAAIEVIASLLEGNCIDVIVATDPHQALYGAISQYVPNLVRIPGDGFTLEHVESFLNDSAGRLMFFDAGGILIRGFVDGVRDKVGKTGEGYRYLHGIQAALQAFIGEYENVFCWGWCEANVPFHVICPDDATVHAIGRYTKCPEIANDLIQYDVQQADDADGDVPDVKPVGRKMTETLERLGPLLRQRATLVSGVGVRPDLTGITAPLLSEQYLDTFLRPLDRTGDVVHIVGIQNETVRRSAASWLYSRVLTMGQPSVLQEGWDLAGLGRYLSLQVKRPSPRHVIGCYLRSAEPASDDSDWQQVMRNLLTQWVSDLLSAPAPQFRITLFCPTWLSGWADREGIEGVKIEHYLDGVIFEERSIREWLELNFKQLSIQMGSDDFGKIMSQIVSLNGDDAAIPASVIPEALAFWALRLKDKIRSIDSQGVGPERSELGVFAIAQEWTDLKDSYRDIGGLLRVEPAYPVDVPPSRVSYAPPDAVPVEHEEPPTAGGDWEVRPRRRDAPREAEERDREAEWVLGDITPHSTDEPSAEPPAADGDGD